MIYDGQQETLNKHQKTLNRKIKIDTNVIGCLALLYTVRDELSPKIKTHEKLFFEEANSNLDAYYTCKKIVKKLIPLCDINEEMKRHKELFNFFGHKIIGSDNDRLYFFEAVSGNDNKDAEPVQARESEQRMNREKLTR